MKEELPIAVQIAALAIQIGVILFAARFCGVAAQKMKVPSVLGELIAGIVIGPFVLGGIGIPLHGFEHGLFPLVEGAKLPVSTPLYSLATLGSIVLLFMSGLETDLRMFFRYSVAGTIVGLGGVIFAFAFGDMMGMMMFKAGFMDPRCLFLGILSTATSVGITARILSEKKRIDSPEGTTILAAAVIDDVLGIICLAIVMGIVGVSGSGGSIDWGKIGVIAIKSVGIWLGVTALGLVFAHKIAKFLKVFPPSGTYAILAFGLSLLLAGLFEQAGLAMIVGAYVMGLSLSKTDISFAVQHQLEGISNFLVPIFFVVMGMLVDVRVFSDGDVLKWGLIYSFIAVMTKIVGCAVPAYFMNFNMIGAVRIGMGMIPRGEVALIIAGIGTTTMMKVNGVDVPVLDSKLFGIAIMMTLITTLVAPPLLAAMLNVKKKGVKKDVEEEEAVNTFYELPSESVRDFVTNLMLDKFRREGFRHNELGRGDGLTHFRREAVAFTLIRTGNTFKFESSPSEALLIRTVMYETFVEIHHAMTTLKEFAAPGGLENAVSAPEAQAPGKKKDVLRINKVLSPDAVVYNLKAENTADAIRELVARLMQNGVLKDAELCEKDVLERESIMSTTMPGGVALPHARTNGTQKLVAAIGISRKGCAVDGREDDPTHIFVLSLCPKDAAQPYLQFVAQVAGVLTSPEKVAEVMAAPDANAVRDIFLVR